LGNFDESIKWYKQCIEVSPGYDYPYYGLGIAYNNKNEVKSAIYWLEECIKVNPSYDCPYYALANIYKYAKQYHKAIEYYETSLKYKAVDPLCFANLGQSWLCVE
jgi:tetratricopeptide (TPR) repeat protein